MRIKIFVFLRQINWILANQLGINLPKCFRSFPRLLRYFRNLFTYLLNVKIDKNTRLYLKPCLHDHTEESGDIRNEYFWQDLYVAKKIYGDLPLRHIDVGSRLDGFIGHVSIFTTVTCLDIRPMPLTVPNVEFLQCDICNRTDSLNRPP